jgi:hypothetical protein
MRHWFYNFLRGDMSAFGNCRKRVQLDSKPFGEQLRNEVVMNAQLERLA